MKASSLIIKGSICVLGLVGAGSIFSAPANANQASATGSVVVTRSDMSSVSVSGEVTLPSGMYYDGALTVTPTYADSAATSALETATVLTVTPGTATAMTADTASSIEAAVAAKINDSTTTFETTSYINAVSGALD